MAPPAGFCELTTQLVPVGAGLSTTLKPTPSSWDLAVASDRSDVSGRATIAVDVVEVAEDGGVEAGDVGVDDSEDVAVPVPLGVGFGVELSEVAELFGVVCEEPIVLVDVAVWVPVPVALFWRYADVGPVSVGDASGNCSDCPP